METEGPALASSTTFPDDRVKKIPYPEMMFWDSWARARWRMWDMEMFALAGIMVIS